MKPLDYQCFINFHITVRLLTPCEYDLMTEMYVYGTRSLLFETLFNGTRRIELCQPLIAASRVWTHALIHTSLCSASTYADNVALPAFTRHAGRTAVDRCLLQQQTWSCRFAVAGPKTDGRRTDTVPLHRPRSQHTVRAVPINCTGSAFPACHSLLPPAFLLPRFRSIHAISRSLRPRANALIVCACKSLMMQCAGEAWVYDGSAMKCRWGCNTRCFLNGSSSEHHKAQLTNMLTRLSPFTELNINSHESLTDNSSKRYCEMSP